MIADGLDADRLLVATLVAELRKAGWTTGRALELVSRRLPQGRLQAQLHQASSALWRGEHALTQGDPLLGLLTRGDAAGPEALAEAIAGFRAAVRASDDARGAIAPLAIISFLFVALLTGEGWVLATFHPFESIAGAKLPAATEAALVFLSLMRWLGGVLLGVAAFAAWRWRRAWVPGVRALGASGLLRQYAAALRAGVDHIAAVTMIDPTMPSSVFASRALPLDALERIYGERRMQQDGPDVAASALAQELEYEGAASAARFQTWAPLVLAAVVAVIGVNLLLAMYLPIFAIAGRIQ